MDLEKLEKLEKIAKLVLKDLSESSHAYRLEYYPDHQTEFKNLMKLGYENIPEHREFFSASYSEIGRLHTSDACSIIRHLLEILEVEKASESKIKEGKIFESAEEKLKQASRSFRNGEYSTTFNNLNTALELILKDRLGIPTTITKINTSKIIEILVSHKIESYPYLSEASKHVLVIDNKIKHQGYSPSKVDCINGIKAMEELISKLRSKEIKLSEDIRNKIYEGL